MNYVLIKLFQKKRIFFEINKIDQTLARLIRKKKGRQTNFLRNEFSDVTYNSKDIKRIIGNIISKFMVVWILQLDEANFLKDSLPSSLEKK